MSILNHQIASLCLLVILVCVAIVCNDRQEEGQQLVDVDLKRGGSFRGGGDGGGDGGSTITNVITNDEKETPLQPSLVPLKGFRSSHQESQVATTDEATTTTAAIRKRSSTNDRTNDRVGEETTSTSTSTIVDDNNDDYVHVHVHTMSNQSLTISGSITRTEIPSWSSLPRTPFTNHVLDLIELLHPTINDSDNDNDGDDDKEDQQCADFIKLHVTPPAHHHHDDDEGGPVVTVMCDEKEKEHRWCRVVKNMFETSSNKNTLTLPYNVSIGFGYGDFTTPQEIEAGKCVGSSALNGKFCMPNMGEIRMMDKRSAFRGTDNNDYRWDGNFNIQRNAKKSWEERSPIPIFRGTAWVAGDVAYEYCEYNPDQKLEYAVIMKDFPKRFAAVDYSVDHPELLNARFSAFDKVLRRGPCLQNNVTNGLAKLLPADPIPEKQYFHNYQVALVLSGIGAAFRLNLHFMTGTAVMLQDYEYKEWYTPYLQPFVHYIPLSEDLHDLEEMLLWVRDHPAQVKAIAEHGRAFHENYLTFAKNEEHIYELLYRYSEYTEHMRRAELPKLVAAPKVVSGVVMAEVLHSEVVKSKEAGSSNAVLVKDNTMVISSSSHTKSVQTGVGGGSELLLHDGNSIEIPPWSTLPRSRFTSHILQNIQQYNPCNVKHCDERIEFKARPSSQTTIIATTTTTTTTTEPNVVECVDNLPVCDIMRRIFETKSVPFNVTMGVQYANSMDGRQVRRRACFGNSSPGGTRAIPNLEEIWEMSGQQGKRGTADYRWMYDGTKPWEERYPIPVFRGTAWLPDRAALDICLSNDPNLKYSVILQNFPKQFTVVDFSVDHPDLLNARFKALDVDLRENCGMNNATNGLDKIISVFPIPEENYFGDYQVALALASGVSPAFEVSRHLMVGTAVILQEFEYTEWFVPYLEPYVHYIPLSKDFHDLEEVLLWVKEHSEEVKAIAENGRAFHEEYLTFDSHEEHLYELVYRLAEYTNFNSTTSGQCSQRDDETVAVSPVEDTQSIDNKQTVILPHYWSPSQQTGGDVTGNATVIGNLTGNMTGIPSWSRMPRSTFTDHVLENIQLLNISRYKLCHDPIEFTIQARNSIPNIACADDERPWCEFLRHFFQSKPLPYNVSVGFDYSDFTSQSDLDRSSCLSSSAPNGKLCMPNMEELARMVEGEGARGNDDYEWQYDPSIPWEERSPLPIFRGTAWVFGDSPTWLCRFEPNLTYPVILKEFPKRFVAVDFSVDHPDLLDARFSGFDKETEPCMKKNATNGLHKLLPMDPLSPYDYYSMYQVALVLPGIGAAFRLNRHFMTGTAVIFQEFQYKEWYIEYLKPFVHYIPLAEDHHDLEERLLWVKNHPGEVKIIAENGHAFYEKYLTLYKNTEHIYEFIYRLAEYTEYRATTPDERDTLKEVEVSCTDPGASLPPAGNMTGIPSWSKLPRSRFTDHLLDNIQRYDFEEADNCDDNIQFLVQAPYNPCAPAISCRQEVPLCSVLKTIFETKSIPFNASMGFTFGTSMSLEGDKSSSCFGSSSPSGKLSIINIEELNFMYDQRGNRGDEDYRWMYDGTKPWDNRNPVPIFRSTAWLSDGAAVDLCLANDPNLEYSVILQNFAKQFTVVDFSVDHPDLLNARFSDIQVDLQEHCGQNKATNGLDKILTVDPIPEENYFGDYQVALALSLGVSPAFEVTRHMMVGTAVILQEFEYTEWFVPYLKPYVHYIPLSKDLHDLEEVLLWVKEHSEEVKVIAENGRAFYEEYLTFDSHEEHLYELVYRLAEYKHYLETGQTDEAA